MHRMVRKNEAEEGVKIRSTLMKRILSLESGRDILYVDFFHLFDLVLCFCIFSVSSSCRPPDVSVNCDSPIINAT